MTDWSGQWAVQIDAYANEVITSFSAGGVGRDRAVKLGPDQLAVKFLVSFGDVNGGVRSSFL